jgi:hypothetical protein
MDSIRKCAKCGIDLIDTTGSKCPMCGSAIVAVPGAKIWIGALVQFGLSTVFMLIFGFPKFMIGIFGGMILIGTALSAWVRTSTMARRTPPPKPTAHPVLFKFVTVAMALCSLAFFSILLFGFVMFLNSWQRWHQYEGQRHHRSEFQVERVYYQKHSRGGADVYASGTVEGQREWMSLEPYLHAMALDQGELESRVPQGTSIPIYLFPDLKGRARVRIVGDLPPAQGYRRSAMSALNYGLAGLALTAGIISLLRRMRRVCFVETEAGFQQVGASQIS